MNKYKPGDHVLVEGVPAKVIKYEGSLYVEKATAPNKGLRILLSRANKLTKVGQDGQ